MKLPNTCKRMQYFEVYLSNMTSNITEIGTILAKYNEQESDINKKLSERVDEIVHKNTEFKKDKRQARVKNMTKSIIRNKEILNELESMKGALRSKAIYSPSEMQWDEICRKYQEAPALQVSTWRCHLPVFV